jgi:hypothetical protein
MENSVINQNFNANGHLIIGKRKWVKVISLVDEVYASLSKLNSYSDSKRER